MPVELKEPLKTVVSCVLGVGLSIMFRKVCRGNNCVIIKGPNPNDVVKNVYKMEGECYKYEPYIIPCEKSDKQEIVRSS